MKSDHPSSTGSTHPMATSRPLAVLLLIAIAFWLIRSGGGCEVTEREQSVRPGINDEFLKMTGTDVWVERFEGESREIFQHRARIVTDIGLQPGDAVADIGAGTGLFTFLFAEAVGPNGKVYAVDISPEFIELIQKRADDAGLENVEAVRNTEKSVELPPDSLDIAFICDTYHHFEYPRSTLASIRQSLRPGGQLVIIDFRRIEGVSREWVLDHVRAGEDVFTEEILAAGFESEESPEAEYLAENYFIRFRKPSQ